MALSPPATLSKIERAAELTRKAKEPETFNAAEGGGRGKKELEEARKKEESGNKKK